MPIQRRTKQTLIAIFSILTILCVDQYSKSLVMLNFRAGQGLPIIRNILHITFVKNTGAAFGLFRDFTIAFIVISISAVIFISCLIIKAIKSGKFLYSSVFNIGLIAIVSGALGNLIDRIKFGYVVDFIDVRIWPVFNIADSAITIGSFLLLISFLTSRH